MQKEYFLPASILIAGVLVAGAVIYSTGLKNSPAGPTPSNQKVPSAVTLELNSEDVILGDPKAPVTVVAYEDYQCPFCGRFFSQSENLIKENFVKTGKVKMVYRHFAFLGPESVAAAEATECAKDQGKFWEYHDALYVAEIKDGKEHNGNLNETLFKSLASQLGLDTAKFSSCVTSKKYANKVQKDYDQGVVLGVSATPTVFINSQKFEGALPYSQFETVIKALLQ